MELKAVFKVDTVITKVDKKIPFTNEVIKAGIEAEFVTRTRDKYIISHTDFKGQSLYLEYDISELDVKGELRAIDRVNPNQPHFCPPTPYSPGPYPPRGN